MPMHMFGLASLEVYTEFVRHTLQGKALVLGCQGQQQAFDVSTRPLLDTGGGQTVRVTQDLRR